VLSHSTHKSSLAAEANDFSPICSADCDQKANEAVRRNATSGSLGHDVPYKAMTPAQTMIAIKKPMRP
jgi:hypothetical protein